jgi:hypothetical protein
VPEKIDPSSHRRMRHFTGGHQAHRDEGGQRHGLEEPAVPGLQRFEDAQRLRSSQLSKGRQERDRCSAPMAGDAHRDEGRQGIAHDREAQRAEETTWNG